jgi:subtilisin-like proprotein convertase family protein
MKYLFTITFAFILTFNLNAQNSPWRLDAGNQHVNFEKLDRNNEVHRFSVFQLDFNTIENTVASAPHRESEQSSQVVVSFPVDPGTTLDFTIYKAPVMHRDLAQKYPGIESYVGVGIQDKSASVRFSVTTFGVHAVIFSAKHGTSYIDPYTKTGDYYMVYKRKDLSTERLFECLTIDESTEEAPVHFSPRNSQSIQANTSILRRYRMAMACTVEYAAFHVNAAGANGATEAEKKAIVLAAMNVTMTRVNGIYEKDMSLTMELVANNDQIIFINQDNFSNNSPGQLINQSQQVINQIIGFSNYDIGHTVSTGGGGLAQLNSPCTNNKARGITGLPSPVGDPFDVDYVAHEIGHQFGATHTFNNSCGGNRSNQTAVEPGSGNTIMAYAGICPPNVQNNSNEHFHAVSLTQMDNFVAFIGNCSVNIPNGNNPPVVLPVPNYIIPHSTPFVLDAVATDEDGDVLTYCWEQTNNQISTQPPLSFSVSGPNFRSLPPSLSSQRFFPNYQTILSGSTANTWEVVPAVERAMNFSLIVRDNQLQLGGQTARINTLVSTTSQGPFVVTSQNTSGITWEFNSTQEITWDVVGTNAPPINTTLVNIYLSTDNGQTFDVLLASNTPNDGAEVITVPNVTPSTECRIKIEPVNNIYFALNTTPFSIGVACDTYSFQANQPIPDGAGQNTAGPSLVSTFEVVDDLLIEDLLVNVQINHTWIGDLVVVLEHPDGTQATLWNRNCNNQGFVNLNVTFQDGASPISCASPTNGTFASNSALSVFNGKPRQGDWKLIVTDFFNADTGNLVNWTLDFGCETFSNNLLVANQFSIYPNPNQGSFKINLKETSSENTTITVYDLQGRKIYQSQPDFSQHLTHEVQLQQTSSGLYMVQIQQGNHAETHKILVK